MSRFDGAVDLYQGVKRSIVRRSVSQLGGIGPGLRRATGGGERRTLTVDEAAQALGISRSTVYECVRNGSLPALRFRRRIVISAVVIDQLLGISDLTPEHSTRSSGAG